MKNTHMKKLQTLLANPNATQFSIIHRARLAGVKVRAVRQQVAA